MNEPSRQLVLDLPLRQALGREDFLVADTNSAAVALIDQWPSWPSYGAIIIGPAASGKSHLAEVWRQKSDASLFSTSALSLESMPVGTSLVIDVEGHIDERALFHALNLVKQNANYVLMMAQRSPSEWGLAIPDLLSRLKALPMATILAPDDALLRSVLVKHFHDRQISVDVATINYILLRMPRSLDIARQLVTEIDRRALIQKAEVTRPFVAGVMALMFSPELFNHDD